MHIGMDGEQPRNMGQRNQILTNYYKPLHLGRMSVINYMHTNRENETSSK